MEILKGYIKAVSLMNEWVGRIDSFVIIPLVFITIYEVIMRKFFNAPTIWVFETSNQLYSLYFMMGFGYAMLHGNHVNVDVFYRKLSLKKRALMDIVCFLIFFFPFCIIVFWKGLFYAGQSWQLLERSQSVFRVPLYPIKTIIPLMALTLLLQGIAVFIKRLYVVFRGKELGA
ncbi:MAG TPA: C4-dicarboxylate ABC transporter permease [Candidatus Atribacteria bacterium]|nr:C4-dicarboxylate ABC transporter permease [Candidatus Atribacteria bacterium]